MNQLTYPQLSEKACRILAKRYLLKDSSGRITESPEEMFSRVAHHVASAEAEFCPSRQAQSEEEFFAVMMGLEFLPNSPTLMNAGTELGQLAACFVLPLRDSIEGIFSCVREAALIHKSGGGCGFDFSPLRPKDDLVGSTNGVASGPVSFIEVFDAASHVIKQGGRRRAANMGVLRIDHPDILEFIKAKTTDGVLSNFNLSVAVPDRFMSALERGEGFSLVNPHTRNEEKQIPAAGLFDAITDVAWKTGEPGVLFIDHINKANPTPELGKIRSTNPCGEVPLLPYESCNLGSVNLSRMTCEHEGAARLDYERLTRVVHTAVRFLDNVIEVNRYPLAEIERMTKANRKIGLGVMGFADLLIKLGVPYDSEEALEIANQVMAHIAREAKRASSKLARERGPFPNYARSVHARAEAAELRNATVTSIAPTGSIGLIADCSSGIEPVFAPAHTRKMLDGQEAAVAHPLLATWLSQAGGSGEELLQQILESGSVRNISFVPQHIQRVLACAHDIAPAWHVRMQAAFQKHVDNAVSKTVNLPARATTQDVKEIYLLAHKLGCKGITVYRDGSRLEQVLSLGDSSGKTRLSPRERPETTYGQTTKIRVGCGKLYVTVNSDDNGICEVFTTPGRSGGCPSQSEAVSRVISIALRAGVCMDDITHQLKGVVCQACMKKDDVKVLSCADAIGRVLAEGINSSSIQIASHPGDIHRLQDDTRYTKCIECGSPTVQEARCRLCLDCGYKKCG